MGWFFVEQMESPETKNFSSDGQNFYMTDKIFEKGRGFKYFDSRYQLKLSSYMLCKIISSICCSIICYEHLWTTSGQGKREQSIFRISQKEVAPILQYFLHRWWKLYLSAHDSHGEHRKPTQTQVRVVIWRRLNSSEWINSNSRR